MSSQKIHSFRYGLFLIVLFLFAGFFESKPITAEIRAGWQGSGWAGEGFTGPLWLETGNADEEESLTWNGIAEVQEDRFYLSAFQKTDFLELYAGRRSLPVRTAFFGDSEYPAGFLPQRRRADLLFFRLLPGYFTPGVFGIREIAGPGVYLCFEKDLFIAYHPERKIFGLTARTSWLSLDVEGERKQYQGYASLQSGSEKESPSFRLEAERRPYWDRFRYREESYDDSDEISLSRDETDRTLEPSDRQVENDRKYRSLLAVASAEVGPFRTLAGGMDRGDVAFRIVTLGRNVPNEAGWYALVEGNGMQMQIYRENRVVVEQRLGMGLARRSSSSLFEGIVRFSSARSLALELRGNLQIDAAIRGLKIQPVLLLNNARRLDSFEYMSGVQQGEGQFRFIERARYIMGLRLTSDSVRCVVYYTGRNSEQGTIREWGYLRLEYQKRF